MIRNIMIVVLGLIALLMIGAALAFYYWGWWGLLAVVAGLFVFIWLVKRFGLRIAFWFLSRPMRKQSRALRGASIDLHGVQQAPPPAGDLDDDDDDFEADNNYLDAASPKNDWEDDESLEGRQSDEHFEADDENWEKEGTGEYDQEVDYYDGPRAFYYVDMTISPKQRQVGGSMEDLHWHPTALSLFARTAENNERHQSSPLSMVAGHAFDGSCEVYEVLIWKDGTFTLGDDDYELHGPQRVRVHIGIEPSIETVSVMYYFEPIGEVRLTNVIDV